MTDVSVDRTAPPRPGEAVCWSCKQALPTGPDADDSFCPDCGAIQPPALMSPFARLGLAASFEVERPELDRCYFNLQRRFHPDRFARHGDREKALSQRHAADLNTAYETLKDPVARSLALLDLKGKNIHADGCNTVSDEVLLMEVMEQREALMEATSVEEVAALAKTAAAETDDCLGEIAAAFQSDDLETADRLTTRLKYLVKMADEIRAKQTGIIKRP